MIKRRQLGPAYERSPAERISDWVYRNLLVLGSAIAGALGFALIVNIAVDYIFRFIATGGDNSAEITFHSNHPIAVGVKIAGSVLIAVLIVKTRSK